MKKMAVVMDYQNVHLTAAGVFNPFRPYEESLISPIKFATRLAEVKNASRPGYEPVEVARVEVYRGLPAADDPSGGYARNMAQKSAWERGGNGMVEVIQRPLSYQNELRDGRLVPVWGSAREKGVDVLCALAVCRLARNSEYDVVVLASCDTDLAPALDEAASYGRAKVEAVKWYSPSALQTYGNVKTVKKLWTTSLKEEDFRLSLDMRDY